MWVEFEHHLDLDEEDDEEDHDEEGNAVPDDLLRVNIPPSRVHLDEFQQEWSSVQQQGQASRVLVDVVGSDALPECLQLILPFLNSFPFPAAGEAPRVQLMAVAARGQLNRPEVVDAMFSMCDALMENTSVVRKVIVLRAVAEGVPHPHHFQDRVVQVIRRFDLLSSLLMLVECPTGPVEPETAPLIVKLNDDDENGVRASRGLVPLVMKTFLTGQVPLPEGELHLCDVTSMNRPAVATALFEHPDHACEEIVVVRTDDEDKVDASIVYIAATRGRNLRSLMFTGFDFYGSSDNLPPLNWPTSHEEALAPLKEITFLDCEFGTDSLNLLAPRSAEKLNLTSCFDGDFRVCDLAVGLCSQWSTLKDLSLEGTLLDLYDMTQICSMLTRDGCKVESLEFGGPTYEGDPSLSDDVIEHFFQQLPSMESLRRVSICEHPIPMHLAPTVLSAFKGNHGLSTSGELAFDSDGPETNRQLVDEIATYIRSNWSGRRDVFLAVKDPNNGALQDAALDKISLLANSADPQDHTTLFLCLQLYLRTANTFAVSNVRVRDRPLSNESRPRKRRRGKRGPKS